MKDWRYFKKNFKGLALFSILFGFLFTSSSGCCAQKVSLTRQNIEKVAAAIDDYIVDYGRAPEVESTGDLAATLRLDAAGDSFLKDGWGRYLHYTAKNHTYKDGSAVPQYWLGSGGGASRFDGFLKYILKTGAQDGAIVYSDGRFV